MWRCLTLVLEVLERLPYLFNLNIERRMDEIQIDVINLKLPQAVFKRVFRIIDIREDFSGDEELIARDVNFR